MVDDTKLCTRDLHIVSQNNRSTHPSCCYLSARFAPSLLTRCPLCATDSTLRSLTDLGHLKRKASEKVERLRTPMLVSERLVSFLERVCVWPHIELAAKDKARAENDKSSGYDVNSPAQCHLHFPIGKNGATSGEGEPNEISTVMTSYQNNLLQVVEGVLFSIWIMSNKPSIPVLFR